MKKLLSFGELLIDMLPVDNDNSAYAPIPGGAPANVAVGYQKLGGDAYFCGGMGNDHFASQLRRSLEHYQVNTEYLFTIEEAQTALVIVSLDEVGERSFNFYRHNTADLLVTKAHIDRINWSALSTFHFCSNTLTHDSINTTTLSALQAANTHNILVSFDVNLRYSLWSDTADIADRVFACYRFCDVVKLSYDELTFLAKQASISPLEYTQSLLDEGVTLVFLTDGANPAKVYHQTFVIEQAAPFIKPVDTTCAGDAFIAGVLYHLNHTHTELELTEKLNSSHYVKEALNFGLKCGSKACLVKGAFPALPDRVAILD